MKFFHGWMWRVSVTSFFRSVGCKSLINFVTL